MKNKDEYFEHEVVRIINEESVALAENEKKIKEEVKKFVEILKEADKAYLWAANQISGDPSDHKEYFGDKNNTLLKDCYKSVNKSLSKIKELEHEDIKIEHILKLMEHRLTYGKKLIEKICKRAGFDIK